MFHIKGSKTFKFTKIHVFLAMLILIITLATMIFIFLIYPHFSKYDIEYTLNTNKLEDRTLRVNIRIKYNPYFWHKSFDLEKGTFTVTDPSCTNNSFSKVEFTDEKGIIHIGPIPRGSKYIDFSYVVSAETQPNAAFYDSIFVSSGENIMLFPFFDPKKDSDIQKYISKISIRAFVKDGWKSILPYKPSLTNDNQPSIEINRPDWTVFYNLAKSCYAFGNIDEVSFKGEKGSYKIYTDSVCKNDLSQDVLEGLGRLSDFYSDLFKNSTIDCPLLIFRKDSSNQTKITGYVGGKSMGISFNGASGDEWKSFSHSIYSSYFDNMVRIKNLHFPPNLWLYKGLATYYENLSLDCLPDNLKNKYVLNTSSSMRELYTKYYYFRLKEPTVFKVTPGDEGSALDGQLQFYYYTEAPLVINAIEGFAYKKDKRHNSLLANLLKQSKNKEIDIGKLMGDTVGGDIKQVKDYLSGKTILPYVNLSYAEDDPAKVLALLNSYEILLDSWFSEINKQYPVDDIQIINPQTIAEETINRNLHFSDDEAVERMVGEFSPTVAVLLKQHMLRLDICGLKNIDDPLLKFKLFQNENTNKWNNFIKSVQGE